MRAAVPTANVLSFAAGRPVAGVVSTDAFAMLADPERSAPVGMHAGRRADPDAGDDRRRTLSERFSV